MRIDVYNMNKKDWGSGRQKSPDQCWQNIQFIKTTFVKNKVKIFQKSEHKITI